MVSVDPKHHERDERGFRDVTECLNYSQVCVKTCTYGFNKYIDTETMLLLIDLHQMNKSVTLCLLGGVEGWVGTK